MTLGYSGTYDSGFPDEHAYEQWLYRLDGITADHDRLTAGEHVNGPAADRHRHRVHAADLTLVSGDPASICDAIQLARVTLSVIRVNLAWALSHNVIAIPLAALGYLRPLFAGIAISASSLIVVSNSPLLCRFRPRRAPALAQREPRGEPGTAR